MTICVANRARRRALSCVDAVRVTVLVLAACTACAGGDGPTEPTAAELAAQVASVTFARDTVATQMGVQVVARPTLRTSSGAEITGVPVTYSVSNPAVISVSTIGIITALSVGTVTLTATVNEQSAAVTVIVAPAVATVLISPSNIALIVGQSVQMSSSLRDIQGVPITAPLEVTWSSADSTIVSVTASGRVTARSTGTARVTATVGNASSGIQIRAIAESAIGTIGFGSVAYGILVGQQRQVTVLVRDQGGTLLSLQPSWSTSAGGLATISATGRVTGIAPGTLSVIAQFGPIAASVPLTVFDDESAATLGAAIGDDQFALVPAGTVRRLIPQASDEPPIEQDLALAAPIRIQRTEVTQVQWMSVLPSLPPAQSVDCPRCPVENVTPLLAAEFLAALNVAQPGRGYRLPTEVEWEFAARAGDTSLDYHGPIELVAWFAATMTGERAAQVGLRQPNALGLYDVHGNVSELTASTVSRGGAWLNGSLFVTYHWRFDPANPIFSTSVGVRLVRNP